MQGVSNSDTYGSPPESRNKSVRFEMDEQDLTGKAKGHNKSATIIFKDRTKCVNDIISQRQKRMKK